MNSHYLDLDDLLTTSKIMSCVLETNVKRLGYLNPSSDDTDLKKGTKLELPFWLAQKLKNDDKRILSVTVPKAYRESYREMYKADPQVVDLHSLGPNFYNFALKMPLVDSTQSAEILKTALQLYQGRFKIIMDSAQNATYKEKKTCTAKFDNVENHLFEKGQESLASITTWENYESDKVVTSSVVKRHGKRKRTIDDD